MIFTTKTPSKKLSQEIETYKHGKTHQVANRRNRLGVTNVISVAVVDQETRLEEDMAVEITEKTSVKVGVRMIDHVVLSER